MLDEERLVQETRVPVLKIEGNFSRLRARPAHFVGHLPVGPGVLVNDLKVRQNRPQGSNFAFKVRLRADDQLPNELVFEYT